MDSNFAKLLIVVKFVFLWSIMNPWIYKYCTVARNTFRGLKPKLCSRKELRKVPTLFAGKKVLKEVLFLRFVQTDSVKYAKFFIFQNISSFKKQPIFC